jgi:hypothetical protein
MQGGDGQPSFDFHPNIVFTLFDLQHRTIREQATTALFNLMR